MPAAGDLLRCERISVTSVGRSAAALTYLAFRILLVALRYFCGLHNLVILLALRMSGEVEAFVKPGMPNPGKVSEASGRDPSRALPNAGSPVMQYFR